MERRRIDLTNPNSIPDPKCTVCQRIFSEAQEAFRLFRDGDEIAKQKAHNDLVRFLQTDHYHEHTYDSSPTGDNPDPA